MAKITSFRHTDRISVPFFGKNVKVEVVSVGDSAFDEKGNFREDAFDLSSAEVELLDWLLENIRVEDYSKQILQYVNAMYYEIDEDEISEKELPDRVSIDTIAIDVREGSGEDEIFPDISLLGECSCDEEHGICIGFKNREFFGIASQDWSL